MIPRNDIVRNFFQHGAGLALRKIRQQLFGLIGIILRGGAGKAEAQHQEDGEHPGHERVHVNRVAGLGTNRAIGPRGVRRKRAIIPRGLGAARDRSGTGFLDTSQRIGPGCPPGINHPEIFRQRRRGRGGRSRFYLWFALRAPSPLREIFRERKREIRAAAKN